MKLILFPFSFLYGLVVRIRNALFDQRILASRSFDLPVILVGNLTAGGTGKTPHVEYLAGLLQGNYRIAVLSRGYRRRTRDFRMVDPQAGSSEVGDEPLQIKRKYPEIMVAVDRRRVHGVEELMKVPPPPECILLDDAYQHRSIAAGCSILLIDYRRPPEKDFLLPAGRLREPALEQKRADIIVVTRSPRDLKSEGRSEFVSGRHLEPDQHLYFTCMRYGSPRALFRDLLKGPASPELQTSGVLIVTGVAGKNALTDYAEKLTPNIREIRFRDHHHYRQKDAQRIFSTFLKMKKDCQGEVIVLTTEKDEVKIRELDLCDELKSVMFAVPLEVQFLFSDKEDFDKQILSYVTGNKRSSILHKEKDSDHS